MEIELAAAQRQEVEEESSSLLVNGNGSSSPRHINDTSPLDKLTNRNNGSLSNDCKVCNTAWSRLSTPTRSILLLIVGAVFILATYEFAVDEGVREEVRDEERQKNEQQGGVGWNLPWKVLPGKGKDSDGGTNNIDNIDNSNDDKVAKDTPEADSVFNDKDGAPLQQPPNSKSGAPQQQESTFTKQTLLNTRRKAQELIDTLNEYYGGQHIADSMLVKSWQAAWMLEDEFTLLDLDSNVNDPNEDDDNVDIDGSDVNDSDSGKPRRLGNSTKRAEKKAQRQKNKLAAEDTDDNVDHDHTLTRQEKNKLKKKKQGAKEGKLLVNPDTMNSDELNQHHHYRRQRTTKLVSTMARAILNPHQSTFKIGTIGSSVAAGHDNCVYDNYENQLERTLTPIFDAANMEMKVENAGEGGSCGDTHQNQVYCITHNVSPDVDIIHYSW